MPVPISEWGTGEWLVFGVILLTLIAALAGVYLQLNEQFWHPRRERQKRTEQLNDPIDVSFLVPERSQRAIDYAIQDDEEHLLNEIILPPDSTTLVELRLHPRTKFATTHLTLGCRDDGSFMMRSQKPYPVKLVDVYGQALIEPNRGRLPAGHAMNSRIQYRWNREIRWDGHSTVVIGVEIKTRREGRYILDVIIVGKEIEKTYELVIRVEKQVCLKERHTQLLRCINGDHAGHTIDPIFQKFSRDQQDLGSLVRSPLS